MNDAQLAALSSAITTVVIGCCYSIVRVLRNTNVKFVDPEAGESDEGGQQSLDPDTNYGVRVYEA